MLERTTCVIGKLLHETVCVEKYDSNTPTFLLINNMENYLDMTRYKLKQ